MFESCRFEFDVVVPRLSIARRGTLVLLAGRLLAVVGILLIPALVASADVFNEVVEVASRSREGVPQRSLKSIQSHLHRLDPSVLFGVTANTVTEHCILADEAGGGL